MNFKKSMELVELMEFMIYMEFMEFNDSMKVTRIKGLPPCSGVAPM